MLEIANMEGVPYLIAANKHSRPCRQDEKGNWNMKRIWILGALATAIVASAVTYALTAKVAQIVNFPAGTTSVTLPGSTPSGDVVAYSLACKVNQMLSASLNVPNTTAYIDIFGIATGTLLSPNGHATSFNGTLASTQNYIIEVIPAHGQVVNYTLTVGVK